MGTTLNRTVNCRQQFQSYLPFFLPAPPLYGFLKSDWGTPPKLRLIPGERAVSTLLGSFAVARTGRDSQRRQERWAEGRGLTGSVAALSGSHRRLRGSHRSSSGG